MPEVNIGDIVQFTNGDSLIQGEIGMIPAGTGHALGMNVAGERYYIKKLTYIGYEAKVIKKAEHTLPEVAGLYRTDDNTAFLRLVKPRDSDAYWEIMGREEKIPHRELPYYTLPLILIMEA